MDKQKPKWLKNIVVAGALTGAGGLADGTIEDAYGQKPRAAQKEKATAPKALTQTDKKLINHYAETIRDSQLPDGSIRMKGNQDPVWVVPYFAHEAALGLLAAYPHTKNKGDIGRVARYLKWCCDNREAGGYTAEREGSISTGAPKKMDNGKPKSDAVDSDVALFLTVADRYHAITDKLPAATKKPLENILPSDLLDKHAGICLDTLKDLRDPASGLTYAKPDYPVMYLMDNCEAEIGLEAGARYFKRRGMEKEAADCIEMSDKISSELIKYYDKDKNWFAHARHPSGQYDFDKTKPYPGGMAQVFGISLIDIDREDKQALWKELLNMKPLVSAKEISPDRWMSAAESVGDIKTRAQFLKSMAANGPGPYVGEYGLALLARTEGGIGKYTGEPVGKAK